MAESDRFLHGYSAISEILIAIRRGIERRSDVSVYRDDGSFIRWRNCQLEIEGLRISLRRIRSSIVRKDVGRREMPYISEFVNEVEAFKKTDNFELIASQHPYFVQGISSRDRVLDNYIDQEERKNMTIKGSFEVITKITNEVFMSGQSTLPGLTPIANLRSIVPAQSIAPVQFIVADNRIRVKNIRSKFAIEDKEIVDTAKSEIIKKGEALLKDLKSSNADPRLIKSFEDLQITIQSNKNVVAVGISNISCEMIGSQCGHELSDPLVIKIQAHARSVEMYASQFSDWRRFVENAVISQMSEESAKHLYDATGRLISQLATEVGVVDSDVPRTLRAIREMLAEPGRASKKISYALLKSVENLFSAVFTYSAEVLQETANQTKSKLAKHGSTIVVVSFIGFAASFVTPMPHDLKEVSWVKTAVELVGSQLRQLGK